MIPLLKAETMRQIDRTAIEEMKVPSLTLMENAGRGVAEAVLAQYGTDGARRVVIVCGRGNNGGDGLVAARYLREAGIRPRVVVLGEPDQLTDDARANARRWQESGGRIEVAPDEESVRRLLRAPIEADLVIDALLGTGSSGAPRGAVLEAIRAINRGGAPVVAIDIPSGVDADSGAVPGEAVDADLTITLGFPKRGLWFHPARDSAGTVETVDIGLPREAIMSVDVRDFLVEAADVAGWLPAWPRDAHKGQRGRLMILGGSTGLTGAVSLAARAALRAGAGLVTVGAPKGLNAILEVKLTEAMTCPLPETADAGLSSAALEVVQDFDAGRMSAFVLGPGLSRHEESLEFARGLSDWCDRPMVVDADALYAFRQDPERLARGRAGGPRVLTPHPGEAEWLMGRPVIEIQADRLELTRTWAERLQQVVVLKGAPTVIGSPEGETFVNPTGGPLLASGGTGDVLAGLIGGFMAQGLAPVRAAVVGVFLHGFLADLFEERRGPRGLIAGDLIELLPQALGELLEGAAGEMES